MAVEGDSDEGGLDHHRVVGRLVRTFRDRQPDPEFADSESGHCTGRLSDRGERGSCVSWGHCVPGGLSKGLPEAEPVTRQIAEPGAAAGGRGLGLEGYPEATVGLDVALS